MRFCSTSLILFTTLVSVFADSQILYLKQYQNGTVYSVSNAEDGASLYVASNDDPNSLNNIMIITGGNKYLLSDLSAVNPDGTPHKITINGGLQISTTNPNAVTYALTGYLYVTTKSQAQDQAFNVYVITGSHHLDLPDSYTTVILNTVLKVQTDDVDQPTMSTYVTNLAVPSAKTSCIFRFGIPPDSNYSAPISNSFFQNPFWWDTTDMSGNPIKEGILFNQTEPLQVSLDYWYITHGPISLDLQNNYVSSHMTTASAATTTGLIVTNNYLFDQHTVNLVSDPVSYSTVGTQISAYISPPVTVSFTFNGTGGSFVQKFDNTKNATQSIQMREMSPSTFTVSSTDITAGVFYCQWFTYANTSDPLISTTNAPSSTVGKTGSTVTMGSGSTVTMGPVSTGSMGTGSTVTMGSTVSMAPGSTVTMGTGSTVSVGTGGTSGTGGPSTSTIATTTSFVRSLSVLSPIILTLLMF